MSSFCCVCFSNIHVQYCLNDLLEGLISVAFEPPHDKTNKMACAPSEDSGQPGHSPSLIRTFAVRMKKAWFLGYPMSAQRRLWSDWADAPADLSLRWAHGHFVGFVMRRLIYNYCSWTDSIKPNLVYSSVISLLKNDRCFSEVNCYLIFIFFFIYIISNILIFFFFIFVSRFLSSSGNCFGYRDYVCFESGGR